MERNEKSESMSKIAANEDSSREAENGSISPGNWQRLARG
jgi:hypothetical protein